MPPPPNGGGSQDGSGTACSHSLFSKVVRKMDDYAVDSRVEGERGAEGAAPHPISGKERGPQVLARVMLGLLDVLCEKDADGDLLVFYNEWKPRLERVLRRG